MLAGESLWVLWAGGMGYLFADRWESMSRIASDSAGVLAGAVLAVIGIVCGVRRPKRS